jgi:hypothetical protein
VSISENIQCSLSNREVCRTLSAILIAKTLESILLLSFLFIVSNCNETVEMYSIHMPDSSLTTAKEVEVELQVSMASTVVLPMASGGVASRQVAETF